MAESDIDSMSYADRLLAFFGEYVTFSLEKGEKPRQEHILDAAYLLLHKGIFESKKEMKLQAVMDYGVILPEWAFALTEKMERK